MSGSEFFRKCFICICFFMLPAMVFAKEASFIHISESGSSRYVDMVEIGDYTYFLQRDSDTLDVYDRTASGKDMLLGHISFPAEIRTLHKFEDKLVVVMIGTLTLYNVNGTAEPERVYSFSPDIFNSTKHLFKDLGDGRFAYLSEKGVLNLFEPDAENQYQVNTHSFIDEGHGDDYWIRAQALGFDGDNYYLAVIRSYRDNSIVPELFIEKVSFSANQFTTQYRYQYQFSHTNGPRIIHLTKSIFKVENHADDTLVFGEVQGDYQAVAIDNLKFGSGTYLRQQLWHLETNESLKSFDLSGFPNIVQTSRSTFVGEMPFTRSINGFWATQEGLVALGSSHLFEFSFDAENNISYRDLFYRSGVAATPVLINEKLYIPFENRFDIVKLEEPLAPTLERQQFYDVRSVPRYIAQTDAGLVSTSGSGLSILNIDQEFVTANQLVVDYFMSTSLPGKNQTLFVSKTFGVYERWDASSAEAITNGPVSSDEVEGATSRTHYDSPTLANNFLVAQGPSVEDLRHLEIYTDIYGDIKHFKSQQLTHEARYFEAYEDVLYVTDYKNIYIYEVTAGESLNLQNTISHTDEVGILNLFTIDNYLVVVDGLSQYSLYSLQTPSEPILVSTTELNDVIIYEDSNQYSIYGNSLYYVSSSGKLSIFQLNKAPELSQSSYQMVEDEPKQVVLALADPDSDEFELNLVTGEEQFDAVEVVSSNEVLITPKSDENGMFELGFVATDIHENTFEFKIAIEVEPVNDVPAPQDVLQSIIQGSNGSGNLPLTDVDGDVLTYEVIDNVANGTLVFNQNGSYSYAPNSGFTGTDGFTYSVVDESGSMGQGEVSFTVQSRPAQPVSESSGGGAISVLLMMSMLALVFIRRSFNIVQ